MEPYVLEDMISDLQARRPSLDHEDVVQDPAELLKQRERDLVLAAELGKALLERNQELTRQAEALTEEYSGKLEVSQSSRIILNEITRFVMVSPERNRRLIRNYHLERCRYRLFAN